MKPGRSRHTIKPTETALLFSLVAFASLLCLSCRVTSALAQSSKSVPPQKEPAQQLLREVVWNEVHAQDNDHSFWRYREVRNEDGKTEVLDVFETPHGQIHRLVSVNGAPLSGQQKVDEENRIQKLVNNPQSIEQAQKKRTQDGDEELKLLQMLPNAFTFRYDGEKGGAIKLAFTPNPSFHPDSHESEVFHHMDGTILVEPRTKRLLEIDGLLTSDVKFGAGLLGHLYKGGTFCVRQRDVGQGHWDMTLLDVHMDGRALFFKTIAVRQNESYSDYKRVPSNTTLREAVRLLHTDTAS